MDGFSLHLKGRYARWLPIPAFVTNLLEAVPRHADYYFPTGEAEKKTVRGMWDRTLRIIFAMAGIKGGHARRFRDTFAVELLLQGIDLRDLSILLGHSSATVTEKRRRPWVWREPNEKNNGLRVPSRT